ncbi:heterochromatin protein one [Xylariaceae sp. FL0016]|nr:heterochromatin protein one [Xylariaceae sp. FL0016]
MPPAISDDEKSDYGDDAPIPVASKKRSVSKDDEFDDDMTDAIEGDIENGNGTVAGYGQDEDEDDEDLEDDEYIVEKIVAHMIEADGSLKYKVKWEGYDKKADQTWEEEDNLKENATQALDDYLESVGGRAKIIEETRAGLKTKKRGRPAANTPTNGTKKRRNDGTSETPPASASVRTWKPPAGSWEDDIESIDACHDENTGKLIVYLTWKNGRKTQHDTKVIYQRCPQKMLHFYEKHVKIVMSSENAIKDE